MRIPRTSPRRSPQAFAKLLSSVDARATYGGFDGILIRPGKTINESELWPSESFPRIPLLLECAGPVPGTGRGHHRADYLWVLWQYDPDTGRWNELARAQSRDATWSADLRPIAARAIAAAQPPAEPVALDQVTDRILTTLEAELQQLESLDQVSVLAALEHQVAARIVAIAP